MSNRIGAAIMAAVLALYIVFVAQRGVIMLSTGEPVAIAMGVALLVLPVIGAWALWREVQFGRHADRLGRVLEAEGALPQEDVAVYPSGRPRKEAGDELFPRYRAEVEAHPDDWRCWYRLGLVYNAAGDRTRARQAIRKAIAIEKHPAA
ncbi:hypothetical protein [Microbacterium sp. NC79]|uniref:hypothetical protein n=1 Tax=Microbacterium sp. NC79 TaxID=2851009 RepID=UPI001C2C0C9B|nr:hypothetical protein [Microbacterium sp. NC79]